MQAETWEKLNGTGWGEIPRQELNVPEFMLSDYYTVSTVVPVAAYRAQGMGRVKHRQHRRDRQVRHVVNGVFWFLVGVGAFVALGNLGLKLADLMA